MDMELIAKTFQGLEDVLADELRALGAEDVRPGVRMVAFRGDKAMLYRANFCCRTALRILKPIHTFAASDADELYEAAKQFDWEQLLSPEKTFVIDSTVYSEEFRHSRFVTYRVKDAIADFFMEKYGKRPSIRLNNADIQLNVHIYKNEVTLSLDSSGEPLYRRGYRVAQTEAPINEVLAAGLLLKAGWKGDRNLVDPMCGSGTFLIEAALIARNINPGVFRNDFAFEHWPDFDPDLFDSIYNDDSGEREFAYKIYGSDISPKAIAIASENIKSAGVGKAIDLKVMPIQEYQEAPENGMLITNPPYGERIAVEDMEALYDSIGERLKKVFKGYHAWIIGYRPEYFDKIGLKPSVRIPVLNGALECEFREYVMFEGSYADFVKQGNSIHGDNPDDSERTGDEKSERSFEDRGWRNQGDRFADSRDFRRRDDDRWERDRRGVRRERAKNPLEEKYHKPYVERMRDENGQKVWELEEDDRDKKRYDDRERQDRRDDRRGGWRRDDGGRPERGFWKRDGDRRDDRGRQDSRDDRRSGWRRDDGDRPDRGFWKRDDDRRGDRPPRFRRKDDGPQVFEDEKVRRAVRFRKPRLFDDSEFEDKEVVMRHRSRKDEAESE